MKSVGQAVIAAALLMSVSAFGQSVEEDNVDFVLGGGLLFSSGYSDYVDDVYGPLYGTDGGEGWLDLYVGVEIRPAAQFGILLGCDMMINGVDASGGPLAETYANVIMMPSVYGQLYFTEKRMFYVNAGIGLPLPDTGSDYFEFENNGLSLGANLGVEIADVLRIEGGYLFIPVTAKATAGNPVYLPGSQEDYDFGGLIIRMLLAF